MDHEIVLSEPALADLEAAWRIAARPAVARVMNTCPKEFAMSADVAAVLEAAESLPADQRRELVELLAAGLDDEVVPPLSEEWRREIAARLADYDAGRVEAIPWSEVRASLAARGSARG